MATDHFFETTIADYDGEAEAHVISLPSAVAHMNVMGPGGRPGERSADFVRLGMLVGELGVEIDRDDWVEGGFGGLGFVTELAERTAQQDYEFSSEASSGVLEELLFAPLVTVEESLPVVRSLGYLLHVGAGAVGVVDGRPVLMVVSGLSGFVVWLVAPTLAKTREVVADEVSEHVRGRVRRWLAEREKGRDREEAPSET
jgi:hypothetical protein